MPEVAQCLTQPCIQERKEGAREDASCYATKRDVERLVMDHRCQERKRQDEEQGLRPEVW